MFLRVRIGLTVSCGIGLLSTPRVCKSTQNKYIVPIHKAEPHLA